MLLRNYFSRFSNRSVGGSRSKHSVSETLHSYSQKESGFYYYSFAGYFVEKASASGKGKI